MSPPRAPSRVIISSLLDMIWHVMLLVLSSLAAAFLIPILLATRLCGHLIENAAEISRGVRKTNVAALAKNAPALRICCIVGAVSTSAESIVRGIMETNEAESCVILACDSDISALHAKYERFTNVRCIRWVTEPAMGRSMTDAALFRLPTPDSAKRVIDAVHHACRGSDSRTIDYLVVVAETDARADAARADVNPSIADALGDAINVSLQQTPNPLTAMPFSVMNELKSVLNMSGPAPSTVCLIIQNRGTSGVQSLAGKATLQLWESLCTTVQPNRPLYQLCETKIVGPSASTAELHQLRNATVGMAQRRNAAPRCLISLGAESDDDEDTETQGRPSRHVLAHIVRELQLHRWNDTAVPTAFRCRDTIRRVLDGLSS